MVPLASNSPLTSDHATTQAITQAKDTMPIEGLGGYQQVEGYGDERRPIRTTQQQEQQQQHTNDPDLMAASALLDLAESDGVEGLATTPGAPCVQVNGVLERGGSVNDTNRRAQDLVKAGPQLEDADSESVLGGVFFFLATLHKEGADIPGMIMEFLELTREYNEDRISLVEMKAGVEDMLRGCCDLTAATSRTRVESGSPGPAGMPGQTLAHFGRCFQRHRHQDLLIGAGMGGREGRVPGL